MINASSVHFINSTLNYDIEEMKTNHSAKPTGNLHPLIHLYDLVIWFSVPAR